MSIVLRATKGAALTHNELDGNFRHLSSNFQTLEDYGAVGDGETDDSAAFQAAYDAGVGPVSGRPGSRYLVNSLVYMESNVVVVGATIVNTSEQNGGIFRVIDFSESTNPARPMSDYGFINCAFEKSNVVAGFSWISLNNPDNASTRFVACGNRVMHTIPSESWEWEGDDNWWIVLRGAVDSEINDNYTYGPIQLTSGGSTTDLVNVGICRNNINHPRRNGISLSASQSTTQVTADERPKRERIRIKDNIIFDDTGVTSSGIFVGVDGSSTAKGCDIIDLDIEGNAINITGGDNAYGVLLRFGADLEGKTPSVSRRVSVRGTSGNTDTAVVAYVSGGLGGSSLENCEIRNNPNSGRIHCYSGPWAIHNPNENRITWLTTAQLEVFGGSLTQIDMGGDGFVGRVFGTVFARDGGTIARFVNLGPDEGETVDFLMKDCTFRDKTNESKLRIATVEGAGTVSLRLIRPLELSAWQSGERWEINDGQATPVLVDARARGTATILDTESSVVISHGLGVTPVSAIATPRANEAVWISARSSTTITVMRTGTSGALDVDWQVET